MTQPIGGFVNGLDAVLPAPSTPPIHNGDQTPHAVRKNLGAIIGGAVGGIVLAALLLCAFLVWRRRNARPEQVSDGQDQHQDQQLAVHELPNTGGVYELPEKKP